MWRRRMKWCALAATRLIIATWHHNKTWISISNRSMSLKGEKSLIVVLQVEGSDYSVKRGSL